MPQLDTLPILLITGAAGDLGRSLAKALDRDHRIAGLDLSAEGTALRHAVRLRGHHPDAGGQRGADRAKHPPRQDSRALRQLELPD